MTTTRGKRRRGLALVSPERRREIARRGARALHKQGKAHKFTRLEAIDAANRRHDPLAFTEGQEQRVEDSIANKPTSE